MTQKLISPIRKHIERQIQITEDELREAQYQVSDLRYQIDTLKRVPGELEIGARVRVRNLREVLPIELEQYRGVQVEITRIEKHASTTGFNIHFSYLGVPAGALDLSWFEAP